MINFLLAETATNDYSQYLMLGVLVIFFVGMMFFSSRTKKKQQEKVTTMINSINVGTTIKTIGGFIGTVIEVIDSDNAFIIETGIEGRKSTMKIDKSAIYATGSGDNAKTADDIKPEVYDETVE